MSKKSNKRNTLILTAFLCLCLLLSYTIEKTGAFFSSRSEASGTSSIKLGQTVTITEDPDVLEEEGNKDVTLENTGDTPVIVRVGVFADANYLKPIYGEVEGDWVDGGDGFWYYTKVLQPGDKTSILHVELVKEKLPDDPAYHFEIVLVEEAERVVYDGSVVATPDGWAAISY